MTSETGEQFVKRMMKKYYDPRYPDSNRLFDLVICGADAADRIAQLEAALRPFAECARVFDPDMLGGTMPKTGPWQSWPRMVDDKLHMYELTVENLRDARAALGEERT